MLKFYYSKDSSALAAHILLEDVGADYDAVEVSIADGAHLTPEFKAISLKARIPVLETPDGVITENPAILEYIATLHPVSHTLPHGLFAQTQARSLAAYLASTMQVAFAHNIRGARWARKDSSLQDMQAQVGGNLHDCAAYLEATLPFAPWALGDQFSYCDPYLLLPQRWFSKVGLTMDKFPRLSAHRQAMEKRQSVQKALQLHGLDRLI